MTIRRQNLSEKWRKIKTSSWFHNVLVYLAFVAVSVLFWIIISMNDSVTRNFSVRLNIVNIPDSVTFISDPPVDMHVTVRDKGTNILRSGVAKHPAMDINFREYAENGIFRMTKSDLMAAFRGSFGSGVQIASMSLDSLRVYYTESPGKRVPVVVRADATAASGNIIAGPPVPLSKSVLVYSYGNETDTITRVYTDMLVRHNLAQTSVFDVKIKPIPNVRVRPSVIRVRLDVDPLIHKDSYAVVETVGVPTGESLLLFPNRVPVSYYIPMSRFNSADIPLKVVVRYEDTKLTKGNKLPVIIAEYPEYIVSPQLHADSVEYTLVRL